MSRRDEQARDERGGCAPSRLDLGEETHAALCREAHRILSTRGRGAEGVETTSLVHDLFWKLAHRHRSEWRSREHFLAAACTAMHHLLLDLSRRQGARKRGGRHTRLPLHVAETLAAHSTPPQLLDLVDLLDELAERDSLDYRIALLRFCAGLRVQEVARLLDASTSFVEKRIRFLKLWFGGRLSTPAD